MGMAVAAAACNMASHGQGKKRKHQPKKKGKGKKKARTGSRIGDRHMQLMANPPCGGGGSNGGCPGGSKDWDMEDTSNWSDTDRNSPPDMFAMPNPHSACNSVFSAPTGAGDGPVDGKFEPIVPGTGFGYALCDKVVDKIEKAINAASDADAVVAIAKTAGFVISADDLKKAQAEVSDEELEAAAGGGSLFNMFWPTVYCNRAN